MITLSELQNSIRSSSQLWIVRMACYEDLIILCNIKIEIITPVGIGNVEPLTVIDRCRCEYKCEYVFMNYKTCIKWVIKQFKLSVEREKKERFPTRKYNKKEKIKAIMEEVVMEEVAA